MRYSHVSVCIFTSKRPALPARLHRELMGQHLVMEYLTKNWDHFGKLLGVRSENDQEKKFLSRENL